jgi:hypothetical protein
MTKAMGSLALSPLAGIRRVACDSGSASEGQPRSRETDCPDDQRARVRRHRAAPHERFKDY